MALFASSIGFLLLGVAQAVSRIGFRSDANIFVQDRISLGIDVGSVNPCGAETNKEMNLLGMLLYGIHYERKICPEFRKIFHSNDTKKMSLSKSTKTSITIMAKNFADVHNGFEQYKEAVVIANVFTYFDNNGDNKIGRREMDNILEYLGEKWDDEKTNKLMRDLDHLVPDQLLQPAEFFFWFTWPAVDESIDFDKKIADIKRSKKNAVRESVKQTDTDTIALQSSAIPNDPAEVKKVFGRFTQFQHAMQIIFMFKFFDSNWDGKVDKKEMTDMLDFLEPGRWSPPEIDSLVALLDMLTKDKNIQLSEWFFWFTPTFLTTWEPAIHAASKRNKSQADIPQRS